jgi:hypothetical protein
MQVLLAELKITNKNQPTKFMDWFQGKSTGNHGFYMFEPGHLAYWSCRFSPKKVIPKQIGSFRA